MGRILKSILVGLCLWAPAVSAFAQCGPLNIPGEVQAECFEPTNQVGYYDTTPGNQYQTIRLDEDVDLLWVALGGTYAVAIDAVGEYQRYNVNIATSGTYTVSLRYSSGCNCTPEVRLLVDGVVKVASAPFPWTGGFAFQELTFTGVSLDAGNRVLEVQTVAAGGQLDLVQFTLESATCMMPVFTSHPADTTVTAGQTASFSVTAGGQPPHSYSWYKDGLLLPGETGSQLTISNAQEEDEGSYRVRVSNPCGALFSNQASLTVDPAPLPRCVNANGGVSPGRVQQAIHELLADLPVNCDWQREYRPNFPDSLGDGSFNIPPLAAAAALLTEPVSVTDGSEDPGADNGSLGAEQWWLSYLAGELGERGNDWFYGGKELTSGNYQHYNIAAVMTVHFEAWRTGREQLRMKAKEWLRATFAIHSMAAVPTRPNSIWDRGNMELFDGNYSGPFVALPGMRYSENHWQNINRSILFAKASGMTTNARSEVSYQRNLREFLEENWKGPGGNVYGLTGSDQADLQDVVANGDIVPILDMLDGIRPIKPLRFVGWPGVRAVAMDGNSNSNTAPTYGMVWFAAPFSGAGNELHVLYPWTRSAGPGHRPFRQGPFSGHGRIDIGGRRAHGTNAPGSTNHPLSEPEVAPLPMGLTQFDYTLQ